MKEKMKQAQDEWEKREMEQQSELASVRKAHADRSQICTRVLSDSDSSGA